MQSINSISEFLLSSGSEYLCFDMARGIVPLDNQTFFDYEQGKLPVARPRQQLGWFGLLFWNRQLSEQHYIWFIKLPVDEAGCLQAAARLSFLQIIVEALGQQLEKASDNQGQLPDNPYNFTPSQQQMADFNSVVRRALGKAHSQYFQPVMDYLQGKHDEWQRLSVQGIADAAAEIAQGTQDELVINRFKLWAPEVQSHLLNSLENHAVSQRLSQFLVQTASKSTAPLSILRALQQSAQDELVQEFILTLLEARELPQTDLLQVVAGRHWLRLKQPQLRQSVMLKAAQTGLFTALFQDLVQIPALRSSMLALLRDPHNPPLISKAIGDLFADVH